MKASRQIQNSTSTSLVPNFLSFRVTLKPHRKLQSSKPDILVSSAVLLYSIRKKIQNGGTKFSYKVLGNDKYG